MTDVDDMKAEGQDSVRTYRALTGWIMIAAALIAAVFVLCDAAVRGGWQTMLLLAPWVLLVLWILYEIGPASFIRMDDDGVRVQNMLRRTSFGWKRVRDIDLRWQLVFALFDDTTVTSFGGPARARPRKVTGSVVGEADRRPAQARVPGGYQDLAEIRDRWESAKATADAPILRSWDVPALIALAVIVLWAVAAALIAYS